MTTVATEVAFLQVPELATGTIGNIRRSDENVLIVVGRRNVLIEVAVVVTPGVGAVQEEIVLLPIYLNTGFPELRESAIKLGDYVGRSTDLATDGAGC